MAHLSRIHHLLQGVSEVGDDDDGAGTAVVQLMLQFARGIQRVDVHRHHPGAQDAKQGDGVLQQVGHHQRHAIALLQAEAVLQVGGKGATALLQLAEGHHLPHIDERRLIRITRDGVFKHLHQRRVMVRIDLRRHILRIAFKPNLFQGASPLSLICVRG